MLNLNSPPDSISQREWQYHGLVKLLFDSLPSKNQRKKHMRILERAKSFEEAYDKSMLLVERYNDYKISEKREKKRMYVPSSGEIIVIDRAAEEIKEPYIPVNFDIESIKKYCWSSKEAFEKIYRNLTMYTTEIVQTPNGLKYIYHHRPGATILFVAHLDFVCGGQTYRQIGNKFYLQNLDDRLGVYLICAGLPKLLNPDVKWDILFTDGEETGRSTARFFSKDKCKNEYNWMAEMDRRGNDVVMYSFESPEMRKILMDNNFRVGVGSYTDIASLTDLGVKGFNFGIGYQDNHSVNAYFDGDVLDRQMVAISNFINKYHQIKFPHEHKVTYINHSTYREKAYAQEKIKNGVVETNKVFILTDKGFVEKTRCNICDNYSCGGLIKCKSCKIDFHNSKIVSLFGHCAYCLAEKYTVNSELIDVIREWYWRDSYESQYVHNYIVYTEKDILEYIKEIREIVYETDRKVI